MMKYRAIKIDHLPVHANDSNKTRNARRRIKLVRRAMLVVVVMAMAVVSQSLILYLICNETEERKTLNY